MLASLTASEEFFAFPVAIYFLASSTFLKISGTTRSSTSRYFSSFAMPKRLLSCKTFFFLLPQTVPASQTKEDHIEKIYHVSRTVCKCFHSFLCSFIKDNP